MLVAAVVVPGAPVVVPDIAQGAAPELDACRDAGDAALVVARAQQPDVVVVVGSGARTCRHAPGSSGSLRPVGVDLTLGLGGEPAAGDAALPLSVTIGAWWLARSGWDGAVAGLEVARDEAPQVCLGAGAGLADDGSRVALLVVADGTARRGPTAPGYTDDRADAFDRAWVDALEQARPVVLADLDAQLADDLLMAGRPALQVLAGAAGDQRWSATLHYAGDPYGVQYAVASWSLADG